MARPTAILFDKDGTLFDFQATWGEFVGGVITHFAGGDTGLQQVLAEELQYDFASNSLLPGSLVIAGTPAEIADAMIPHLPRPPQPLEVIRYLDETAAAAALAEAVPLIAYFEGLRRDGYAVGVITNDAEAPARTHLKSVGVLDQVSFLAGYDSGHGAKPAPGQLFAACDALGVSPEAAVMVGDSTHDLLAGRAAGTRTVGVLTGVADAADLSLHADVVLPHIGHLPDWLQSLPQ